MKDYWFKTEQGHAVARKECRNEAHAIMQAAVYADWCHRVITVHTRNQHGEIVRCAGISVHPITTTTKQQQHSNA